MESPANRSFVLGTPYSRVGATESYLRSLAALCFRMGTVTHPSFVAYLCEPGTSYGMQRNRIVGQFLTTDAEWLLQVDDDIEFPPNLFDLLVGDGSQRVRIGSVPVGVDQPSNVYLHPECLSLDPCDPSVAPVQRIYGFGGAVMLVHRSVYEEMAERLGYGSWYAMKSSIVDGCVRETEPDLSFASRLAFLGIEAHGVFGLPLTHTKPIALRAS